MNKKDEIWPDPKKVKAVAKYIRQQYEIREHLKNGGSIEDLDADEYGFVQPF